MAFSVMCGCGIDMVPVPGDISAEEIASIMLDIAAVAIRLNKPLGVRLLPIPGKEDTLTIKLSPITMTNLGADDKLDIAMLSGVR